MRTHLPTAFIIVFVIHVISFFPSSISIMCIKNDTKYLNFCQVWDCGSAAWLLMICLWFEKAVNNVVVSDGHIYIYIYIGILNVLFIRMFIF